MITSDTKFADIQHFVDTGRTALGTEQKIGPFEFGADLRFQDGDLYESSTDVALPFEQKKVSLLDYSGEVGIKNLEDLYAGADITYPLGDFDASLKASYSAEDQKKLIAGLNYDLTGNFPEGKSRLLADLSYDVLNQKPSLGVGLQYDLAGDSTFKIGGEFDESSQNVGVLFRKPLRKTPKPIFGKAKGGLAKILGV